MLISLVITNYDPRREKVPMLCDLMRSIGENSLGKNYETVIVVDGPSYVESVNQGMGRANGDYIVVLNDDVLIKDPKWLDKLCVPGVVSAWRLGLFHLKPINVPDAACFCMDRETYKALGPMDERYKDGINFEDTDYWFTAEQKEIPFHDAAVELVHYGNETFERYYSAEKWGKTYHNEAIFRGKWGI